MTRLITAPLEYVNKIQIIEQDMDSRDIEDLTNEFLSKLKLEDVISIIPISKYVIFIHYKIIKSNN